MMVTISPSDTIYSLVFLTIVSINHIYSIPIEHDIVNPNANKDKYTEIINFWKNHKNEFEVHSEQKEVVLIMGNTGAGKTTLVSALIGRKIKSVDKDGELIFVDEEGKIGTNSSSTTLVPELMTDARRNVTYVDCSGFRDNRNVEYQISSLFFQNILMNQIKKIKLILVIDHGSLKVSGNKNDFDDLMENVGEFTKNISKYYAGIGMVVTKIENKLKITNGTLSLKNDDQTVLSGITNFLNNKKLSYSKKTDKSQKNKIIMDLIDVLMERNNNSNKRITLFRQPREENSLENLLETKTEINMIADMIITNLKYVEIFQGDFGYALSTSLKNTIDQLVDSMINGPLIKYIQRIGNETFMYYSQMAKGHNDIIKLRKEISRAYNGFSELGKIDDLQGLFGGIVNAVENLNIPLSLTNLEVVSENIKKLSFFTNITNSNADAHRLLLKEEMDKVIASLRDYKNFYTLLDILQEKFAEYEIQNLKKDTRIANIKTSCVAHTQQALASINIAIHDITNLGEIIEHMGFKDIYLEIVNLALNPYHLKHLKAVFDAFTMKMESVCDSSSKKLTVKGYNIKISDVVTGDCWADAKTIRIFALNKIYIDVDIDKTGAETQLIIIAPTWEIVGGPKIILNGRPGEPHKNQTAESSTNTRVNGAIGLPGYPGGSAGDFYGVGKKVIRLKFLEIHADGGRGGPGQHGGNGADGIPGEALSKSFFDSERYADETKRYFENFGYTYKMDVIDKSKAPGYFEEKYNVEVSGKSAVKPSDGGNGGVGGQGGYQGAIVMNMLGHLVNLTSNHTGSAGQQGRGGRGGRHTAEAQRVNFRMHIKSTVFALKCKYDDIQWKNGTEVASGKNGISGSNNNGRNDTTKTTKTLYSDINSFKEFVRSHLFENIKETELKYFLDELENDKNIKSQYNTPAYVKELVGIENQFRELKNQIDFVSFYNSLLTRVEDYAKTETVLENKKVLNYIYTAALTKLLALKKNRKGPTVVDLYTYLDTIERNVNDIREAQYLQTVTKYRDNYNKTLTSKIKEAEDFIRNKIEPEIDKLWNESNIQINAIVEEINQKKNDTKDALVALDRQQGKIRDMMQLRTGLLPLKLAASALSFFGPIGAGVGTLVTSATSVAESMVLDPTVDLGQNNIYSINPKLKIMSRVTEVFNYKPQLAMNKLDAAKAKLEEYEKELSKSSDKDKTQKQSTITGLKTQLQELISKKADNFTNALEKQKKLKDIERRMTTFTRSEKETLTKMKEEKKYETRLRRINDLQTVLETAEFVFSITKKIENDDDAVIKKVNDQMSQYAQELKNLDMMIDQVYEIVLPDFRQIGETINTVKKSVSGSTHAKLDLTKWNIRTTLRDVKILLQKFTQKMSIELRNNLERCIDKIDEGFSILIDIYDRIDSYADNVKQAEYISNIMSASTTNIPVTDSNLKNAIVDLKLIIQSNILLEKYSIALHAFKQHFFPFAAHVLQKFQLPTSMQLNDTESLRSNIVAIIKDMKNHIDEKKATLGEYSKYIHEEMVFNSHTSGSSPFYVWRHDAAKDDVQRLLAGSEIMLKADITKGLFYNAIKYNDIGINLRLKNRTLQNDLDSALGNFKLVMSMVGNNYYRCGERYFSISPDDDITVSYTLARHESRRWLDPNQVYSTVRRSRAFLSPYGLWRVRLQAGAAARFADLHEFLDKPIDVELVGRGYYIEQQPDFNADICNDNLNNFYDVDVKVKELVC